MAVINLKNCTIKIRDGGTAAAVGKTDTALDAGETTMDFTGVTAGEIKDGDLIYFDGQEQYLYYVKAGTLGDIEIYPPLYEDVAADVDVYVKRSTNELEVKIGEGDLTYSEKKPREYTKDRGKLDTVRDADDEPMDVSFQFTWEWLSSLSGETPTIEEALKQRGNAASWITSSADLCEPYCVDIVIENDPSGGNPNCGSDNEIIILPEFRYETLEHSIKNGSVSVTGKCNATEALIARNVTF